MDTDNRIPCPPFDRVLVTLMKLALQHPNHLPRNDFLNATNDGPSDLVSTALAELGAPIVEAASGYLPNRNIKKALAGVPGIPRKEARFPLIWNRLFLGNEYDGRFTMFFGMRDDLKIAETYLVYALLDHIVSPQVARNSGTFHDTLVAGLKSFRRFLNSEHSGYLVQVNRPDGHGGQLPPEPQHVALRDRVDDLTKRALEDL